MKGYFRTTPFSRKPGIQTHDTRNDALIRAKRVANQSGDWCCVEEIEETADGWTKVLSIEYVAGDPK